MRSPRTIVTTSALLALIVAPSVMQPQAAPAPGDDWRAVEAAAGRPGAPQPGGVVKFGFPRTDLSVTANGFTLKPAFALGSWLAMKRAAGGQAMAMGDLVLLEEEVAPVMSALQAEGVEQTALHNHLMREAPRLMYLHFSAHGDAVRIAKAVRAALGRTGTPLAAPAAPPPPAAMAIDTAGVARALGVAGKPAGGVYQVSVPRRETVREGGMIIPPSMGVATAINFQPTSGGRAAITGDFVLLASEVNPVIRALQKAGIQPMALHGHMLRESPRLFFMHFWGEGDAVTLARGVRSALAETTSKR